MFLKSYLPLAVGLISLLALDCRKSTSGAKDADAAAAAPAVRLSLNDVSIMIPIDKDPNFLKATLEGTQSPAAGEDAFLPADILGALDAQMEKDDFRSRPFATANGPYKLVAMRIDPCFDIRSHATSPEGCQAQLRLLWQPIVSLSGGFNLVGDLNIHAIYNLKPDQFTDVLKT